MHPSGLELSSLHDHEPNGLWFIRNDSAWLLYGSNTWTDRPASPPVANVPLGIMGATDLLLPDTLIIFCKQKKKTKLNNICSPGVAMTAQWVRSVCHASLTRWVGCYLDYVRLCLWKQERKERKKRGSIGKASQRQEGKRKAIADYVQWSWGKALRETAAFLKQMEDLLPYGERIRNSWKRIYKSPRRCPSNHL